MTTLLRSLILVLLFTFLPLSAQAGAADLTLFDDVLDKIEKYFVEPPDYTFLERNALHGISREAGESLPGGTEASANNKDTLRKSVGRRLDALEGKGKNEKTLELAAIRQMVMSLDPHSGILTPEENKDLVISTKGEFAGVGIEISADADEIRVVTPIEGSPAFDAGIMAGDLIKAIDGTPTKGLGILKAVRLIRGKTGTKVILSIIRGSNILEFSLIRKTIRIQSIKSRLLNDGVAYVKINSFTEKTPLLLDDALSKLRESTGTIKGLVLDLRNNPGGLLGSAVQSVDRFIDTGLIVSIRGRGTVEQKFEGKTTGTIYISNIVILVNKGTASAGEIMAGVLQERAGALVVGQKTFGKGTVQTIYKLLDGYALRLTTARYLLPSGRLVQAGISPDIDVEDIPGKDVPLLLAQLALKTGKTSKRHRDDLMAAFALETDSEKHPSTLRKSISLLEGSLAPNFKIPENDRNIAVVIGIENYPDIPHSEYSVSDATLVADYLKALGFAERNIYRLTNEKATYSAIKKTLESWLPNRVRAGARVIVYFSGHGAPEPKSGDAFLVPYDGDPNYLNDTGYPLRRLYDKLGELKAKEIIVLLDSCFSGAGGRSVLAKGARPLVVTTSVTPSVRRNIAVLSAAQGNQISTSLPDKKHGAFTYFFLKAINEGNKSLVDIYGYMRLPVEDEAKKLNIEQSPSIYPDPSSMRGKFTIR